MDNLLKLNINLTKLANHILENEAMNEATSLALKQLENQSNCIRWAVKGELWYLWLTCGTKQRPQSLQHT